MSNTCFKRWYSGLRNASGKAINREEDFQYPIATLSISLAHLDSSLRQQQKQSYSSQPNYKRLSIT